MPNEPAGPPCSVLPPHILASIVERGTEAQRRCALQTLSASERLRGQRAALSTLAAELPVGEKRRTVFDAGGRTRLPGRLVRGEGDPESKDPAINEAYDGAGF
ncbi:MAG: protealysin propeptide domain-containing protein, partial [Thermoanaerobaculia bacterium]